MELDLRGGIRAAPVAGDTPGERQALRLAPDPRERTADPEHVARTARENEADGLDSALVTQSSSWPDPWLVAAWALAATSRLRVAVAHRLGTTAPTAAARSLATLDRLSGGRAAAHLIVGSSDADVLRDGDTLGKEDRYRRAGEYLEVFRRSLTERRGFDHDGEFYTVRDAMAGLWPRPRAELLSFGGSSPAGLELAARYADVYAVRALPLPATRARIKEIRAAAAAHGRTLRIWRHITVVLAATDAGAEERARRLAREAVRLTSGADRARWAGAVQLDRDRERGTAGPDEVASYIRRSVAGAFVGSPEGVAARIELLGSAGVDIVQLDMAVETDEDRDLRRALVHRLRHPTRALSRRRVW
ncbi:LLM class flavin-dependent oxidoreductase [Streptomyces sp. NBC_01803]|uniref:LLM class flavin-dependent oxidoreductase n=1 Tax=Streptomyces sp. NBC_01803 TaxID=2975946 RepID=UPI002DDC5157|nr:LLM class flavin-dependent oxidoreductase [Streptomyces sp. NBC_01803]WSA43613.1 LLM class flavin-dependent oxidoreductase [Streptomyces sp. NBC_01803]